MSEIARRAAVAPSTIKYYMSQGLLPRPVKTSRNMAYYDQSTVERVRLIKELQEKAFLPLSVVRRILRHTPDPGDIREVLKFRGFRPPEWGGGLEGIEERRLTEEGLITAEDLRRLERVGIIDPEVRHGERFYGPDDASIIRNLVRVRKAGFTPQRGFRIEHLKIYREALEELAKKEIGLALQGILGKMKPEELLKVAEEVMTCTNEMIAALHRKIVRRLLGAIRKEMRARDEGSRKGGNGGRS